MSSKKEDKVILEKTKNWQPLMNKLSARTRRNRRRIANKRIRRAQRGEQ